MEIVELWGLPGAGKSTVSRAIASRYGVPVRLAQGGLRSAWRHGPIRSWWLVMELWTVSAWVSWLRPHQAPGIRGLLEATLSQHLETATASHGILFEEGIAHELWRLLYRYPEAARHRWWRRFLRHSGPTIVVLEVDDRVALSRIRTKEAPGPINRELGEASLESEPWRRARLAYETILAALESMDGIRTIRMRNDDGGPDGVSSALFSLIRGPRLRS